MIAVGGSGGEADLVVYDDGGGIYQPVNRMVHVIADSRASQDWYIGDVYKTVVLSPTSATPVSQTI